MKKLLSIVLAMAMILSMTACGSKQEEETTEAKDYSNATIDEIKADLKTVEDGKLTVATSPDFAPYEFYSLDEDGNPELAGFDMALAQYIADYLGLELEVVPMDFDGTISELANKNVDVSMAGYSPDPERLDKMDFSDIYYMSSQSFVSVEGKADQFSKLEDANDAKYTVAAQTGSIQMDLANENTPNADIVSLTKVTDIVAELVAKNIDGAYIETPVAEAYAKNYPELKILFEVPEETEGSAVGISKGNSALLAGVNLAIKAALEDGSMDKFVAEANKLAEGNTYEGLLEDK